MAKRVVYWDWSVWLGRAAVSVAEAARMCSLSESFLWKVIRVGSGPPLVKIMGRTLILVDDLHAWLDTQRVGGGHDR